MFSKETLSYSFFSWTRMAYIFVFQGTMNIFPTFMNGLRRLALIFCTNSVLRYYDI